MKKKIAAALVTLAIMVATYGLFFLYVSANTERSPEASGGLLDLTQWSFDRKGVVALDGEWDFYPNRLVSGYDVSAFAPPADQTIKVPGSWSDQMDIYGMGSYRLRLKVDDDAPIFGLKTSTIQIANRIFVNGEEIGASGSPAADKSQYTAKNAAYVSYFRLEPGWNDIIVHVANYELKAGSGITESIFLGHADQISALREKALAHDWITVSIFLIIGLYFIGFFALRKNDYSLLAFGLLCVLIAVFSSTRGERILFSLFGPVPFWLFLRIQIFSAQSIGLGFLLYVYTAFRPYCSKRLIRFGVVLGVILIVLSLGFVVELNNGLYRQLTTVYATLPLLYATYIFVLASFHKVEGSLYLVIGAIALHVHSLVQNMNVYFAVPIYMSAPLESFLFLLMLSLLMSLRFSNAFRKVEELSVQLLKADKLKDEFLARTSHEFKTPLHGVMNISKAMLADPVHRLDAQQEERLRLITNITERLSQLVYDILDLSKLKQGELVIHPVPVDTRSVVDVQMRMYAYLSADRSIGIENLVPEQLPYALADESRLSQIIGNLLDNAVKYTRQGNVTVTAAERGGTIEVTVRDTGQGMDELQLPHIFEPFRTFETNTGQHGFGLGLPIVKQLVELQNGTISVQSTPGAGTSFTFTLPAAERGSKRALTDDRGSRLPVKTAEYTFPTPYYSERKGNYTVLIADDQFSNLKVLIDALQPLDCSVIAVKNGYEAIEQIEQPNTIRLAILDLMMPGLSGYEVCQRIRRKYSMLELPVLMVTAAIQPQDKVAAFEAGANDFLPKPFDLSELRARVSSLLTLKELLGKAVDLEVAFLQSQIKPHFLYNVLNSIVALSHTNMERSRTLTTDLASYLRGSFRFSNLDISVLFREELHLIETYLHIEQARFKDRIRFESDIAPDMLDAAIPPLLLQPLIENAVRHGIGQKPEGGTVKLSAYTAEGHHLFRIEDDGVGMDREQLGRLFDYESQEQNGVGLLNINKRLKYKYGTKLELESAPGRGTKVTVRIPAE
ncbi:ATP-binding protein [Paenibacillus ginsengarvi]|uniref:histidine kinase n=1 Tax=Paenibacillus ginsengarvi TaxID=400777 RepID=A0A3B0CIX0_9BACL|nr:ATP-binding protein [Paenibacillus ginsengarvi]RKN83926.1 response regulator [Paenibacillus ginsengarvi]